MFSRKACAWGKTKRFKSGYVSFFSPSSSAGLVFFYMLKYFNFKKNAFWKLLCRDHPHQHFKTFIEVICAHLGSLQVHYQSQMHASTLHSTRTKTPKLPQSSKSRLVSQSSHIHIAVGGPIHNSRIKPHISIKVEVKSKT